MMRTSLLTLCAVLMASSVARADEDEERNRKIQVDELLQRLPKLPPEAGREVAAEQPPPWCNFQLEGSWGFSSIARNIEGIEKDYLDGTLKNAHIVCHFAKDPVIPKVVRVILQHWMNLTGQSQADAIASIQIRLQKDKRLAEKAKVCEELEVSDEIEGEEKAFSLARRALLGCVKKGWADKDAMWDDDANKVPDDLLTYLDMSSSEPDELVRLAYIVENTRYIFQEKNDYFDHRLLAYVMDQYDYKALNVDKLKKLMESDPYKDSVWAKSAISENVGRAKIAIAMIEAEVKKKTAKDPDWKRVLIDAPQKGVADWQKDADKWKTQLAHSNAFEKKFWGPSKKALAGCLAELLPDFRTVAKTLKHGNAVEFDEALSSDPIASLLFMRLAACATVDGDQHWGQKLLAHARDLRYSRGPRFGAYYAAFDALNDITADRAKFPVSAKDLPVWKNQAMYDRALGNQGGGMGFVGDDGEGTVKTAVKKGKAVEVSFVTEKRQVMSQSCVTTNRIIMFRHDGTPIYYQKCKDTGLITVDVTAQPITVPQLWADGIVPGAIVKFVAAIGKPPTRAGLPMTIYADKMKKKLTNFMGIGL